MMDLAQITKEACLIAKEAGKYLLQESKHFSSSAIEHKGKNDLVSYVDRQSESIIIKGLQKILPGSNILAEESGQLNSNSEFTWIIDPLDGTTNFVHGIPLFAVCIALKYHSEIVVGIIYEPNLNECFYAWKGSGAWLNERQIQVSQTNSLSNSLVATGFPYAEFNKLPAYMNFITYTVQNTRGMRRLGSAAVDLAYVACGRIEVFFEYGLKPWDVAAGSIIVQEAGGIVTDFSKNNNYLFGQEIIASNSKMYIEFTNVFGQIYGS